MSKLILLNQSECAERTIKLGASAAAVQAEIHLIACSTLDHVRMHGDTNGVVRLLNALPNGQRVKALSHWYKTFSNGKLVPRLDKESGTWVVTLSKARTDADFRIDDACETTFADLTTERDPVSVTLDSFIRNLERTANNAEMHDGTNVPKVTPEARAAAAKLVAFWRDQAQAA